MSDDYQRTRSVVDANKGVTNVLESETIRGDLASVYDKIYDTLTGHYGPYSKFAVIIDPSDVFADPVFTKDGINIVRAMEFVSPMENEIKKMVAYIGTRMETAVGDGTTSSMMFTCRVLKYLTEYLYDDNYKYFTFQELRTMYEYIVECIKKYVDNHKYTWKSLMERDNLSQYDAVYKIAYAQAYSSSHGDEELAKAVAEIFAGTPPESWKAMTFQRRTYESTNRFDVETSEGQFEIKSDPIVKSIYNMEMGTWFEYKDAILCILNDTVRFESPAYDQLKMYYDHGTSYATATNEEELTKRDKPMILICHNRIDSNTYDELLQMVRASHETETPFAIFTYDAEHPTCNDVTVLQAVCGFDPASASVKDRVVMVDNVYAKYKRSDKLVLDGLYPKVETEDGIYASEHPYRNDPRYDYFEHLLEIFDDLQSGYDRLKMTPKEKKDQANYRRLYNKLRFTKQKFLVIGGSAYDNLAMFDVVDDVITATSKAMSQGVVASNGRMIYHAVKELGNTRAPYEWTCRMVHICKSMINAISQALEDMAGVAVSMLPFGIADVRELTRIPNADSWSHPLSTKAWLDNCVNMIDFDGHCVPLDNMFQGNDDYMCKLIVQPANADLALVSRFGELALKFVLAERIIMRGGAVLGGSKK